MVLDKRAAGEFVDELDLELLPACPMCLFDVACALAEGRRVWPATVTRTVSWVWPEIADAVRAQVVNARMYEAPGAEDALRDLDENGARSKLARAIVEQLAERMAGEIRERRAAVRRIASG